MIVDDESLSNPNAYPIKVTVKRVPLPKSDGDERSGLYRSNLFTQDENIIRTNGNGYHEDQEKEELHCRYVVGCDGARSWVRQQLGLELEGDSANVYWAAFDALVKTNVSASVRTKFLLNFQFMPFDMQLTSIRMKNVIHSASAGSVLTVPREAGMVRVYTQLGNLQPGQRVNRADVTLEKLLEKTKLAIKPFHVDFPYVHWYTCYEIGQRLCHTFSKHDNHVFIAGDACHTHSPKAGQGMNVLMMDA